MENKKKLIAVIIMCAVVIGFVILIFAINANKGENTEKETKATSETSAKETSKETEPETESTTQEETAAEETDAADVSYWDNLGAPASITRGSNGYIVAIDAGHQAYGNFDQEPNGPNSDVYKAKVAGGTHGLATGKTEYQLTLEIALLLKQELINGNLIFAGKIYDNTGKIRCEAGEAISDDTLLEDINWLVKGVEILE